MRIYEADSRGSQQRGPPFYMLDVENYNTESVYRDNCKNSLVHNLSPGGVKMCIYMAGCQCVAPCQQCGSTPHRMAYCHF